MTSWFSWNHSLLPHQVQLSSITRRRRAVDTWVHHYIMGHKLSWLWKVLTNLHHFYVKILQLIDLTALQEYLKCTDQSNSRRQLDTAFSRSLAIVNKCWLCLVVPTTGNWIRHDHAACSLFERKLKITHFESELEGPLYTYGLLG